MTLGQGQEISRAAVKVAVPSINRSSDTFIRYTIRPMSAKLGVRRGEQSTLVVLDVEVTWTGSAALVDGSSGDSFDIDGNHAEGTATLISDSGEGPESATFEATCGQHRAGRTSCRYEARSHLVSLLASLLA
jgi:hypothetical protein